MVALIVVCAILTVLLLVPIGGEAVAHDGRRETRLIWAGIRFRIKVGGASQSDEPPERPETGSVDEIFGRLFEIRESALRIWDYFGGDLPRRLIRTLSRFYHCLRIRVHRLDLLVALSDPAATGIAYGAACAAAALLPPRIPVRVMPDFVACQTKLNYRVSLQVIPARVLFEMLRGFVTLRLWAIFRIRRQVRSALMQRRTHV